MLRAVATRFPAERPGGFYAEEIRIGADRRGFRVVTSDGREAIMAYVQRRGPRVGKYGEDVGAGVDGHLKARISIVTLRTPASESPPADQG